MSCKIIALLNTFFKNWRDKYYRSGPKSGVGAKIIRCHFCFKAKGAGKNLAATPMYLLVSY